MTATHSGTARLWIVLGSITCLTAVLHWANLLYLAHQFGCSVPQLTCPGTIVPWVTPDTQSYRGVAGDIARRGFLHASYLRRTPGFPLMLGFGHLVFGDAAAILWLVPLVAAAACVAIGWLAFALTGTTRAAAVAGILFSTWPNTYQFAPLLMTDAIHAYVAVIAFAATVAWLRTQRTSIGCLTAALWMATQSIRPTFFPLPVLLPILLWRRRQTRRVTGVSLGIWLVSAVVPTFIVTSNYVQHGMAIVSTIEPATLACYAIPRMKEDLGLGAALALRKEAWERYELVADPKERVALQRRDAWEFLHAHPWQTLWSFGDEFTQQLFAPLRPSWHALDAQAPYPSWQSPPWLTMYLFWLCATFGLAILAQQQPRIALFLLLAFVTVMAPATTSHWVGARLRLPLDLLFIPVVALFFDWLDTHLATIGPGSRDK